MTTKSFVNVSLLFGLLLASMDGLWAPDSAAPGKILPGKSMTLSGRAASWGQDMHQGVREDRERDETCREAGGLV
jgi:hypothetical protein